VLIEYKPSIIVRFLLWNIFIKIAYIHFKHFVLKTLKQVIWIVAFFTIGLLKAQQIHVEGGHITWEFKQEPKTRNIVGAYGRMESVTDTVGYIRFYLRTDNQLDTWGYFGGIQIAKTNLRTRLTGERYYAEQNGSFKEGFIWFYAQTKTYENLMANHFQRGFITTS